METAIKIGIIICDRYHNCAGGKCFRAMKERSGAFEIYQGKETELVGFTTCDGCPGGNIEYAAEEMLKNGANVIHLATGFIVGYPPCPYIDTFKLFLETRYGLQVVIGTHPIPQKYLDIHSQMGTWADPEWKSKISPTMTDENIRLEYN